MTGDTLAWIFLGGIVWVLVFGLFGGWVAGQKGRDMGEGFVLGCLFGPLGVIVEGLLPVITKPTAASKPAPAAPPLTRSNRGDIAPRAKPMASEEWMPEFPEKGKG